jgi:O-antigen/teichoic acid export membrane protein
MSGTRAVLLHAKSFMASPEKYFAARRHLTAMGTQVARWSDLGNYDPAWDERTALMARMVPQNASVLEFGAGREQLVNFLPPGCTYQPSDLAPRSPSTLVCNLNEGFPQLTQHYDVIIFSGVLEYIHDLEELMRRVRQHCTECIVSYTTTNDLDCIVTRRNNGWVHHYSDAAIIEVFNRAGFEVAERQKPLPHETIYRAVASAKQPLNNFFRNMTRTVSASGIQFLITLCTTPIMTRLYDPAAYAVFGIVNTTATVMIGIGLLSLPNAYCAEKDADVRTEIIQTMLLLLMGLFMLALLLTGTLAVVDVHHDGILIPKLSLFLLPVLVLTYGLRQIVAIVAVQRSRFKRVSLCQVIEPVFSRGGSITFGALISGRPAFILASVALGHISTILVLVQVVPHKLHGHWRRVLAHLPHVLGNLRRYGDFVFFGTISQQAQQLVVLGIQLSIAAYFSGDLTGQYILAVSTLTLPITLIAMSTAPVVLQHFVSIEATDPTQLPRHLLMAVGLYLLAGACVMLPIFFFGEDIFRIAFGSVWMHAGHIAATLSLAYIGMFALTGVQGIFTVTRRLKLQFIIEIGTCVALLGAITLFKTMEFDQVIFYLSLIWLSRSVVLLLAALMAALQHPHQHGKPVHD